MLITDFLEKNAREYPDDIALVELNPEIKTPKLTTWKEFELIQPLNEVPFRSQITWSVFEEKANRVANFLIARGIVKGDKVAILLMNCLDWLPIYFGVLKAGAIAVPLNFRYSADEIEYCVNLAEADILVFGPEFVGRVEEIADNISNHRLLLYLGSSCPSFAEDFGAQTANYSSKKPNIQVDEDDYGAIYFSSGTTGFPKAILHKHSAITHAAVMEQRHHGQQKDDTFLCIPPLYHTGAKMHWFGSLRGTTPEIILDTVSKEHCTVVWLLVPWAQDILDAIDNGSVKLEDYQLDQWRLMHIGAQPVPPSMIKHWMDYFPNHQYDTNYGLSESTGPGCVHLGIGNEHKVGAIGIPGYNWQCKIVNEDYTEVERGHEGELCVKGPGVMECYYKNDEASAESLPGDGWLRTGDVAVQDEDGFYYLVDRKKDVIVMGGENIYPVEIEDFLRGHEKINDAAVIGLPDKRLGEIPGAIIQLKQGMEATEEEIDEFCGGLARYKRPRKIIFAEVPRNATGKIEKPALRKKYGAEKLVAQEISMNTESL